MNELKSELHLLSLEHQIGEVDKRLDMLQEQIVAMVSEENGTGTPSELLFITRRVQRSLKLLRLEILEGMG